VGLRVETFASAERILAARAARSARLPCARRPFAGLERAGIAARAWRLEGAHLPIIFITAHGDIPMSVNAMKSGAVEFLTKPFRDQDLLEAIQNAINLDRVALEQRKEVAALRGRYDSLTPRERGSYGTGGRRIAQ